MSRTLKFSFNNENIFRYPKMHISTRNSILTDVFREHKTFTLTLLVKTLYEICQDTRDGQLEAIMVVAYLLGSLKDRGTNSWGVQIRYE